jgi:hypothetical protein
MYREPQGKVHRYKRGRSPLPHKTDSSPAAGITDREEKTDGQRGVQDDGNDYLQMSM